MACTTVLVSSFLLPSQMWAQTADAKPAANNPKPTPEVTKLVSRSQLVLVPVVVTNKSGEHVSGLKRDAFRIEESGKVREAGIFEEITTVAPDTKTRAALPAQGHSNFTFGNTDGWRITIVLMDMVNTPVLAQNQAKLQLIKYLEKSLRRPASR
jgi:VWFA-related protein